MAGDNLYEISQAIDGRTTDVTLGFSTTRIGDSLELVLSEELESLRAKVRGLTNKVAELKHRNRSLELKNRRLLESIKTDFK